jgi:acyl-CoA synthetase (NDP forming)
MLLWAEQDPSTAVVALYLESFGNPRKFARIARRVARTKPIVAVKGGGSKAGSRAARSHTAAAASSSTQVEALFRQAGVIVVNGLGELLDTVSLLAHQPLPAGRRLGVVGNAGGPCVLAADAAEAAGLTVPELAEATRAQLRMILPAGAAVANPVDTIASVSGPAFEKALRAVLTDDGIDGLLAIVAPTPLTAPDDLPAAVRAAAEGTAKPVLAVVLGQVPRVATPGQHAASPGTLASPGSPGGQEAPPAAQPAQPVLPASPGSVQDQDRVVCSYSVPEDAVRAFARAAEHTEWLRRPVGAVPHPTNTSPEKARAIIAEALAAHPDGCWLPPDAAADLVAAYGVPVAPVERVGSPAAAAAAATRFASPVVLKAANPDLVHKSDRGGVRLGLATPAAAAAAYTAMTVALGADMGGAIIQPEVEPGVETLVGVVQDPSFGPLVAFGLGGVFTDLIADRGFRLVPLTDADAAELVRSIRGAKVLLGYRGSAAVDLAAVEDVLIRVARLADDVPELQEMDINPLIVAARGAVAVDVKVRLGPAPETVDPTLRRLR